MGTAEENVKVWCELCVVVVVVEVECSCEAVERCVCNKQSCNR
jgi:hypothetical protein